jgi:hypothetical protein
VLVPYQVAYSIKKGSTVLKSGTINMPQGSGNYNYPTQYFNVSSGGTYRFTTTLKHGGRTFNTAYKDVAICGSTSISSFSVNSSRVPTVTYASSGCTTSDVTIRTSLSKDSSQLWTITQSNLGVSGAKTLATIPHDKFVADGTYVAKVDVLVNGSVRSTKTYNINYDDNSIVKGYSTENTYLNMQYFTGSDDVVKSSTVQVPYTLNWRIKNGASVVKSGTKTISQGNGNFNIPTETYSATNGGLYTFSGELVHAGRTLSTFTKNMTICGNFAISSISAAKNRNVSVNYASTGCGGDISFVTRFYSPYSEIWSATKTGVAEDGTGLIIANIPHDKFTADGNYRVRVEGRVNGVVKSTKDVTVTYTNTSTAAAYAYEISYLRLAYFTGYDVVRTNSYYVPYTVNYRVKKGTTVLKSGALSLPEGDGKFNLSSLFQNVTTGGTYRVEGELMHAGRNHKSFAQDVAICGSTSISAFTVPKSRIPSVTYSSAGCSTSDIKIRTSLWNGSTQLWTTTQANLGVAGTKTLATIPDSYFTSNATYTAKVEVLVNDTARATKTQSIVYTNSTKSNGQAHESGYLKLSYFTASDDVNRINSVHVPYKATYRIKKGATVLTSGTLNVSQGDGNFNLATRTFNVPDGGTYRFEGEVKHGSRQLTSFSKDVNICGSTAVNSLTVDTARVPTINYRSSGCSSSDITIKSTLYRGATQVWTTTQIGILSGQNQSLAKLPHEHFTTRGAYSLKAEILVNGVSRSNKTVAINYTDTSVARAHTTENSYLNFQYFTGSDDVTRTASLRLPYSVNWRIKQGSTVVKSGTKSIAEGSGNYNIPTETYTATSGGTYNFSGELTHAGQVISSFTKNVVVCGNFGITTAWIADNRDVRVNYASTGCGGDISFVTRFYNPAGTEVWSTTKTGVAEDGTGLVIANIPHDKLTADGNYRVRVEGRVNGAVKSTKDVTATYTNTSTAAAYAYEVSYLRLAYFTGYDVVRNNSFHVPYTVNYRVKKGSTVLKSGTLAVPAGTGKYNLPSLFQNVTTGGTYRVEGELMHAGRNHKSFAQDVAICGSTSISAFSVNSSRVPTVSYSSAGCSTSDITITTRLKNPAGTWVYTDTQAGLGAGGVKNLNTIPDAHFIEDGSYLAEVAILVNGTSRAFKQYTINYTNSSKVVAAMSESGYLKLGYFTGTDDVTRTNSIHVPFTLDYRILKGTSVVKSGAVSVSQGNGAYNVPTQYINVTSGGTYRFETTLKHLSRVFNTSYKDVVVCGSPAITAFSVNKSRTPAVSYSSTGCISSDIQIKTTLSKSGIGLWTTTQSGLGVSGTKTLSTIPDQYFTNDGTYAAKVEILVNGVSRASRTVNITYTNTSITKAHVNESSYLQMAYFSGADDVVRNNSVLVPYTIDYKISSGATVLKTGTVAVNQGDNTFNVPTQYFNVSTGGIYRYEASLKHNNRVFNTATNDVHICGAPQISNLTMSAARAPSITYSTAGCDSTDVSITTELFKGASLVYSNTQDNVGSGGTKILSTIPHQYFTTLGAYTVKAQLKLNGTTRATKSYAINYTNTSTIDGGFAEISYHKLAYFNLSSDVIRTSSVYVPYELSWRIKEGSTVIKSGVKPISEGSGAFNITTESHDVQNGGEYKFEAELKHGSVTHALYSKMVSVCGSADISALSLNPQRQLSISYTTEGCTQDQVDIWSEMHLNGELIIEHTYIDEPTSNTRILYNPVADSFYSADGDYIITSHIKTNGVVTDTKSITTSYINKSKVQASLLATGKDLTIFTSDSDVITDATLEMPYIVNWTILDGTKVLKSGAVPVVTGPNRSVNISNQSYSPSTGGIYTFKTELKQNNRIIDTSSQTIDACSASWDIDSFIVSEIDGTISASVTGAKSCHGNTKALLNITKSGSKIGGSSTTVDLSSGTNSWSQPMDLQVSGINSEGSYVATLTMVDAVNNTKVKTINFDINLCFPHIDSMSAYQDGDKNIYMKPEYHTTGTGCSNATFAAVKNFGNDFTKNISLLASDVKTSKTTIIDDVFAPGTYLTTFDITATTADGVNRTTETKNFDLVYTKGHIWSGSTDNNTMSLKLFTDPNDFVQSKYFSKYPKILRTNIYRSNGTLVKTLDLNIPAGEVYNIPTQTVNMPVPDTYTVKVYELVNGWISPASNYVLATTCNAPTGSIDAMKLGPNFSSNEVNATLVPKACSGTLSTTFKIFDDNGTTLMKSGVIGNINESKSVTYITEPLPINTQEKYRVEIIIDPAVGDNAIYTKWYALPCTNLDGNIGNISAVPGAGQFSINTNYAFGETCSVDLDSILTIKDNVSGQTQIMAKNDLPNSVSSRTITWLFDELDYGRDYTAIIEYTLAGTKKFTYQKPFSVACPNWWELASLTITKEQNKAQSAISKAYACHSGGTYNFNIKKETQEVYSKTAPIDLHPSPVSFLENYVLNVPENQKAGTYNAKLEVTDKLGVTKNVSRSFSLACPDPSVTFEGGNYVRLVDDPFTLTFNHESSDVCNGLGSMQLEIVNPGNAVEQTVQATELASGVDTTKTLSFEPLEPGLDYIARIKLTNEANQEVVKNFPFSVDCTEDVVTHDFDEINVVPGSGSFSIKSKYSFPFSCNIPITTALKVEDGSTVRVTKSFTGLPSGVTNRLVNYTFSELPYGRTYNATITYTTGSGKVYSKNKDFYVPCPNWWQINAHTVDTTTKRVNVKIANAQSCQGAGTENLTVTDLSNNTSVYSGSVNINMAQNPNFPHSFDINKPANEQAGSYKATVSVTDAQDVTKADSINFTIDCPKPDIDLISQSTHAIDDDPFGLTWSLKSSDKCHGLNNIKLDIINSMALSIKTVNSNGHLSGSDKTVVTNFAPIESGQSYTAKVEVTNDANQKVTKSFPFIVACQQSEFNGQINDISVAPGSPFTVKTQYDSPFACNGDIKIVLDIKDVQTGGIVQSMNRDNMPSGVTEKEVVWPLETLTYGRDYQAILTHESLSGFKQIVTKEFSVSCPSWWVNVVDKIDQETKNIEYGHSGGYACNQPAGSDFSIVDLSSNEIVYSKMDVATSLTSQNQSIEYTIEKPANHMAGDYKAIITTTDAQMVGKDAFKNFTIACPAPEMDLASTNVHALNDDPFSLTFAHYSSDVCHGTTNLSGTIKDSQGTVLHNISASTTTSGQDTQMSASFPVLEPGAQYKAEVSTLNASNQTLEKVYTFAVPCQNTEFNPDIVEINVEPGKPFNMTTVYDNVYACNGVVSANLKIFDGESQIRSYIKHELPAGVTGQSVHWGLDGLVFGQTYKARIEYTTGSGMTQFAEKEFSVGCPSWWTPTISHINQESEEIAIAVTGGYACNNTSTYKSIIKKSGQVVFTSTSNLSVTPNPMTASIPYTLALDDNKRAGNYQVSFEVTDKQGTVKTATKEFDILCPIPEWSLTSQKTNALSDNPFELTFEYNSQDVCQGDSQLTIKIEDESKAVIESVISDKIVSGQSSTIVASIQPVDPGKQYQAVTTMLNAANQTKTKIFDFAVACQQTEIDGSIESIQVIPGEAFSLNSSYSSPFECNGAINATLVIKENGAVILSKEQKSLPANVTAQPVNWSIDELGFGRSYEAELTFRSASGMLDVIEQAFTIACPSFWDINVQAINVDTKRAYYKSAGGDVCNGEASITYDIEKEGVIVGTGTGDNLDYSVSKLNSGLTYQIDLPSNQLAGTYQLNINMTDQQGTKKTGVKEFVNACPAPDYSLVSQQTHAVDNNPFILTYLSESTDKCHGDMSYTMSVLNEAGQNLSAEYSKEVTGGSDKQFDISFEPLEPGKVYKAKVDLETTDGQSLTKLFDFTVACQYTEFNTEFVGFTLVPGAAMSMDLQYDSPFDCNGNIDLNVQFKQGESIAFEYNKNDLLSGVTAEPVHIDLDSLTYGASYDVTATWQSDSGMRHIIKTTVKAGCPDWFEFDITDKKIDTRQYVIDVAKAHACNNNFMVTSQLLDINDDVVGEIGSVAKVFSDPQVVNLKFLNEKPANQQAGLYTLKSTLKDSNGIIKEQVSEVVIPCPAPSLTKVGQRTNALTDDPFAISYNINSTDVCNGQLILKMDLVDTAGDLVTTSSVNQIGSGLSQLIDVEFEPVEPGKGYIAKMTLSAESGHVVSEQFNIGVACQQFDFGGLASETRFEGLIDGFNCNTGGEATLSVFDEHGDEIGKGNRSVTALDFDVPVVYTIPETLLGGEYSAKVKVTDRNNYASEKTFPYTYTCRETEIGEINQIDELEVDGDHVIGFDIDTKSICNGPSNVRMEILTTDLTSLYVASQAGIPGGESLHLSFTVPNMTGGEYVAKITSTNDQGRVTTSNRAFTIACTAPAVVGFEKDDVRGLTASGMAIISRCDSPVNGSIEIKDSYGVLKSTVDFTLAELEHQGINYFQIPQIDTSLLIAGAYDVSIKLKGSQTEPTHWSTVLRLDNSKPDVELLYKNEPVTFDETLEIAKYSDFSLRVSDGSGIPQKLAVASTGDVEKAYATGVEGGITDVAFIDNRLVKIEGFAIDTIANKASGNLELLLRRTGTNDYYTANVSARHPNIIPFIENYGARPAVKNYDLLVNKMSFVIDMLSMPKGHYTVDAILINGASTKKLKVDASFEVPEQLVGGIPYLHGLRESVYLTLKQVSSDLYQFGDDTTIMTDQYQLSVSGYDSAGNNSGEITLNTEFTRPVIKKSLKLPIADGFAGLEVNHVFYNASTGDKLTQDMEFWVSVENESAAEIKVNGVVLTQNKQVVTGQYTDEGHQFVIRANQEGVLADIKVEPRANVTSDLRYITSSFVSEINAFAMYDSYPAGKNGLYIRSKEITKNCVSGIVSSAKYAERSFKEPMCAIRWTSGVSSDFRERGNGNSLYGLVNDEGTFTVTYDYGILYTYEDEVGSQFYKMGSGDVTIDMTPPMPPTISFFAPSHLTTAGDVKLTNIGANIKAGVLYARGDLSDISLEFSLDNGNVKREESNRGSVYSIVYTDASTMWERINLNAKAYYKLKSHIEQKEDYIIAAVPDIPSLEMDSIDRLISTDTHTISGRIYQRKDGEKIFDAAINGEWDIHLSVLSGGEEALPKINQSHAADGAIDITNIIFPPQSGYTRLVAELKVPQELADLGLTKKIYSRSNYLYVYDGSPIEVTPYTRNDKGIFPFRLYVISMLDRKRYRDIGEIVYQYSDDSGASYEDVDVDSLKQYRHLALLEEQVDRLYRVRTKNRWSNKEYVSEAIDIKTFHKPDYSIDGDKATFVNGELKLDLNSRNSRNNHYKWFIKDTERQVTEHTGGSKAFSTEEPDTFYITIMARDEGSLDVPEAYTQMRTKTTVRNPYISNVGIAGSTWAEYGKEYSYTAVLPDIMGDLNDSLTYSIEWIMPDGLKHTTETIAYTPIKGHVEKSNIIPVYLNYWINGYKDETFKTRKLSIRGWDYQWPDWFISTGTSSKETYKGITINTHFKEGMIRKEPVTYTWTLPPEAIVLYQPASKASTMLYFKEPRVYTVGLNIADERGNSTDLTVDIDVGESNPLVTESKIQSLSGHFNAPAQIRLESNIVSRPALSTRWRYEFYLNGELQGVSTLSRKTVYITEPGIYEYKSIMTDNVENEAQSTFAFEISENTAHFCELEKQLSSDVVKHVVSCSDIENDQLLLTWYVDGVMIQSSTNKIYNARDFGTHDVRVVIESVDYGHTQELEATYTLE